MTRTISSFRSEVREITGDTRSAAYHRTDAQIDVYVSEAFRHLYAVRPDARYDENGHLNDVVFPTDATQLANTNVDFDSRWYLGILYFAAARAFETDVTDSVNRELAANYFKQADMVFAM